MRIVIFLLLFSSFFMTEPVSSAEKLINQPPALQEGDGNNLFLPGARFALPDGRTGIIETILPNGQFGTNLGIILNKDGSILNEPQTRAMIIEPAQPENGATTLPDATMQAPANETPRIADIIPAIPDTAIVETPQIQESSPAAPLAVTPAQPETKAPESAQTPQNSSDPEKRLSLAELIPLTPVPDKNKQAPKSEEPKTLPEKKAQAAQPEKKEVKQPGKKAEKQPAKAPAKAKTGEELRIPEQAIKTGNLDFLEGCWQGTRPEYYSKRTIRECFCFGANGKSGKRRVFDPIGHRNCIGATQATLSQNGTLSVTSQGAACDDGERWGQAEMVCRNSGQKTPCSWVFKDANNGRQSYTIPFVKVESCGR